MCKLLEVSKQTPYVQFLKALLAIRPDGELHGSTNCQRGKEQCGRANLDLEVAVSEKARENFQPVLVVRAISEILGAERICA